jgi:3'-5' exoribonuclease
MIPFFDSTAWGVREDGNAVDLLPIAQIKRNAVEARIEARVRGQVEALSRKDTRDGKPYFELVLNDGEGKLTLKAWSDGPAFGFCEGSCVGTFVEVQGDFAVNGSFGVESKRWTARALSQDERDLLLAGSEQTRAKQAADYADIEGFLAGISDPRLVALTRAFIAEYGERFRRAAAARGNHHARRGGLVEHTAQMMRSAAAVAGVYPHLNRDLMITGVLFHDCGKMWENQLPPDGFIMPYSEYGELLGHITLGIELANALWRKIASSEEWKSWQTLEPANEDVRLHLLHLIASHHGELQFGSPVVPKTPEGWALHYVDNMDAKLEMMAVGYANSKQIAPRIQERMWPIPGHFVRPLGKFEGTGEA